MSEFDNSKIAVLERELRESKHKCEHLENGWKNASSACNTVAGERDELKAEITKLRGQLEHAAVMLVTSSMEGQVNQELMRKLADEVANYCYECGTVLSTETIDGLITKVLGE